MNFGLSDEQKQFQSSLRRFLEERCPTTRVRTIMESETGHDEDLWRELTELGIPALVVPEASGGAGLELLDLVLAAEELGRAATPGPFLGNSMATIALVESEPAAHADLLGRVARGEVILSAAYGEESSEWDLEKLEARAEGDQVSGSKPLVPFGDVAEALVVAARDDDGPGLWLVERESPGVDVRPLQGLDATRRLHAIELRDAPAQKLANGGRALRRSMDAGLILLAADAYGGAKRCLDTTVEYVKTREQFGQIIGAFQAVKHQIVNVTAELEPLLALVWYAAHAFDTIPDQAERHAAIAKAELADAFDRAARDSTELHGGIGFTWEYDLHLWFRRSIFDRSFLGEASFHRARAADLAGW